MRNDHTGDGSLGQCLSVSFLAITLDRIYERLTDPRQQEVVS
jgi:hypothetical protein